MNKNDMKLIGIVGFIAIVFLFLMMQTNSKGDHVVVYYGNQAILNADLALDKVYTVPGDNGDVIIEVKNKKVRVNEENSPRHLCSKQGWIASSYESIICLPNKIVVKIEATNEIDAIVK